MDGGLARMSTICLDDVPMNPVELDAIDRKIIEELLADARLPIAILAQRVHLSRHAVRHRVDRLEALKVIRGYTIQLGEGAAKHPTARAIIRVYRKDRMRGKDVTEAIAKIPEVTACYVVSGDSDLILHVEAESQDRVNAIWAHLSALPGVADTNTAFVLSTVVDRRLA
jgi:Lrp/AsnC family transcriptional regulator, leucine-responsive regulatory protein